MSSAEASPVWCVVANIIAVRTCGKPGEITGEIELKLGTRHFSGGTKVVVRNAYWGMGGEQVEVIGKHRGARGLVAMVVRRDWLTNFRVKLAHEPRAICLLTAPPGQQGTSKHGDAFLAWDGSPASRDRATHWCARFIADGLADTANRLP
jgi:hypothetical protein